MSDRAIIGKDTLVPLSALIVAVTLLFGGKTYLDDKFYGIERRLERMEENEARAGQDRWRRSDMRLWIEKARRENPGINLPEAQ